MKKILFVCSANRLRSRTAYEHFTEKLKETHIVDSCGMNRFYVRDTVKLHWPLAKEFTKDLYREADYIFCMENEHAVDIMRRNKDGNWGLDLSKLFVLGIDDIYEYNDPKLIAILDAKVPEYLESLTPLVSTVPLQFKSLLKQIPLRVKLRSIVKQNDKANWIDDEYKGDTAQLENTVRALEAMIQDHIESDEEAPE